MHAGLMLEGTLQPDTAPGGDEAEEQPQSPVQRPPNYLSAMLTYMAQVSPSRCSQAAAAAAAAVSVRTSEISAVICAMLSSRQYHVYMPQFVMSCILQHDKYRACKDEDGRGLDVCGRTCVVEALSYVHQFLLHIFMFFQVGDAVAEADPAPSEAQNYFAMLQQTPSTLLPRLVAQWGCSDSTAERVASLLGSDLVSLHSP